MNVTFYLRPDGRQRTSSITEVNEEDRKFFEENDIAVSMEDTGMDILVYADCGLAEDDDETPREVIEIAGDRDCKTTLASLRSQCEAVLQEAA